MSFYTNHALKAVHIIVVLNRTFRYIHGKFCQDRPCFLTCPLHTHHFCMCACENSLDCSTNMNSWQRAYHGGLTAAFQGVFFFPHHNSIFFGQPTKEEGRSRWQISFKIPLAMVRARHDNLSSGKPGKHLRRERGRWKLTPGEAGERYLMASDGETNFM